jgi:hypothetical protein
MDEARQRERTGVSESIEVSVRYFPEESPAAQMTQFIPGGNRTHI